MPTYKILTAESSKWAARLAKARNNLSALKRAHANPKMSSAGKETLAGMIVKQAKQIAKLEGILTVMNDAPKDGQ